MRLSEYCDPLHATALAAAIRSVSRRLDRHAGLSARGARFDAPAIVEQQDCTTVVEPGNRVGMDGIRNLAVTVEPGELALRAGGFIGLRFALELTCYLQIPPAGDLPLDHFGIRTTSLRKVSESTLRGGGSQGESV